MRSSPPDLPPGAGLACRLRDAAPELLAECIEMHDRLAEALSLVPCIRKKGRPARCIHCAMKADRDRLARLIRRVLGMPRP